MTNFCETGDTARVTFPDGVVVDYEDTPISITCEPNTAINLRYRIIGILRVTYTNGAVQVFPLDQLRWSGIGSFFPIEVGIIGGINRIRIFDSFRNTTPVNPAFWSDLLTADISTTLQWIPGSITLVETLPPNNKRIIVTGNSGTKLFEATFNNCNYSVECVGGCPPNHLDCGGCCLDCASVVQQLRNIRNTLTTLTNNV